MFAKSGTSATIRARRLSIVGVLASTLLGVSACGTTIAAQNAAAVAPAKPAGQAKPGGGVAPVPVIGKLHTYTGGTYAAGMALISDGTNTVRIGTQTVTFPTTVTDASWSSDGSRIVFIDANGNVATAQPDGSSLVVLTTKKAGVTRSNPTWYGNLIAFTERDSQNVSRMESVSSSESAAQPEELVNGGQTDADGDAVDTGNSFPNAMSDAVTTMDDQGMLAYQHEGADGPEVWIVDFNARTNSGYQVAEGSDPAISPDGSKVAFVDGKGQIEVMPSSALEVKSTPAQITFSAADPTDLTWSPDGTRVAFSTVSGIESVAAEIPAHATANPPTEISATPGTVSFLQGTENTIDQFTGTDPVALSISASQDRWPTEAEFQQSQSNVPAAAATIGSSTALSVDQALLPAMDGNGPLLLTNGSTLDPRVAAELRRVLGKVADPNVGGGAPTVDLLGGTNDVSDSVQTAIEQLGYRTQRITSVIAPPPPPVVGPYAMTFTPFTRAVLVDSASPLDELIGSAYAGYFYGTPVLQASAAGLSPADQTWLSLSSGGASNTALFAPTVGFSGQYLQTIAGQEGGVLGYTTAINPATPATF